MIKNWLMMEQRPHQRGATVQARGLVQIRVKQGVRQAIRPKPWWVGNVCLNIYPWGQHGEYISHMVIISIHVVGIKNVHVPQWNVIQMRAIHWLGMHGETTWGGAENSNGVNYIFRWCCGCHSDRG